MPNKRLTKLYDHCKNLKNSSCRKLSEAFKTSKSSIHRMKQKIQQRSHITGADFFESEEGQKWLIRLMVACIFVFGIGSTVGADKIAMFFMLIQVTCFIGASSGSIKRVQNSVKNIMLEYQAEQDKHVKDKAKNIEITACADETFFDETMILLLMDLKSGFIFTEESAKDRSHKTWESLTTHWVSRFKTVKCLVCDWAKALVKLGKDSYICVCVADLFHLMTDISNPMRFAFNRKIKSIEKLIKVESNNLKSYKNKGKTSVQYKESKYKIESLVKEKAEVLTAQKHYQREFRAMSTTLHPFLIEDSSRQTSIDAASKMHAGLSQIQSIQDRFKFPDKKNRLARAGHRITPACEQIDLWWDWVSTSLDGAEIEPEQKQWLKSYLLPYVYWKKQINKTRSKEIKKSYVAACLQAEQKLMSEPVSKVMNYDKHSPWYQWAISMTDWFQRTSSAVEGRNGWLSQLHFMGRGFSKDGIQVQTTLHNYWIKRDDGTTACERLTGIKPPDLFEYILSRIDSVPEPRKRKQGENDNPLNLQGVPA